MERPSLHLRELSSGQRSSKCSDTVRAMKNAHLSSSVILHGCHISVRLRILERVKFDGNEFSRDELTCTEMPKPLMAYPMTNAGKGGAADCRAYATIWKQDPRIMVCREIPSERYSARVQPEMNILYRNQSEV